MSEVNEHLMTLLRGCVRPVPQTNRNAGIMEVHHLRGWPLFLPFFLSCQWRIQDVFCNFSFVNFCQFRGLFKVLGETWIRHCLSSPFSSFLPSPLTSFIHLPSFLFDFFSLLTIVVSPPPPHSFIHSFIHFRIY